MIRIEEIPVENIDEFWKLHLKYLIDKGEVNLLTCEILRKLGR